MSCIGDAWCPQCEQIVYEGCCMCALVCDKHGPVCTTVVPDGVHQRRMHRQEPSQLMEYRNGWCVGWTLTLDGPWQRREPGHPTKSPRDIWREEWDKRVQVHSMSGPLAVLFRVEGVLTEGAGI